MLKREDFDRLAGYLRCRAEQEGFDCHSLHIGPLNVDLLIEQDCQPLGLEVAFSAKVPVSLVPEFKNLRSSNCPKASGFTVYVIQLTPDAFQGSLQPFLCYESKSVQQLLGETHSAQFVIKNHDYQILKVFDQTNGIGLFAFADPALVPSWELYSPMKEFIHLLALQQSCLLLHGAAVVDPGAAHHATVIVGPGGSGKSTLTAYAIEEGMLTSGDDYVLVDLRQGRSPKVWSVYRTLKLHPSSPMSSVGGRWKFWRSDPLTGKSVMLAQPVAEGGSLTQQATLATVVGVSLARSPEIHNPKAAAILSSPYRHPYLHTCMSTVQQMPYRMDATLALARKLHQEVPYSGRTIEPGLAGLQQALADIRAYQPCA